MAEENENGSKLGMILGIIAVVVILVIIGAVFYQNWSDQKKTNDMISNLENQVNELLNQKEEEPEEEMDEEIDEIKDEISEALQEELDYTLRRITILKVELPSSLSDDLDLIADYIEENPEVLEDNTVLLPSSIQAAVIRVREAIEDGYASSETPDGETVEDVQVGDQYEIVGTIEKSEYEDNTLGEVFIVENENLGVTLYFQFSEDVAEEIEDELLGEDVAMTIEITEVRTDGVSYSVVEGPVLAE